MKTDLHTVPAESILLSSEHPQRVQPHRDLQKQGVYREIHNKLVPKPLLQYVITCFQTDGPDYEAFGNFCIGKATAGKVGNNRSYNVVVVVVVVNRETKASHRHIPSGLARIQRI